MIKGGIWGTKALQVPSNHTIRIRVHVAHTILGRNDKQSHVGELSCNHEEWSILSHRKCYDIQIGQICFQLGAQLGNYSCCQRSGKQLHPSLGTGNTANGRGRLTEQPHHCVSRNRAHSQGEHLTVSALCLLITLLFFFPGTLKEIACFGQVCLRCQLIRPAEMLSSWIRSKDQGEVWAGDKNVNLVELHEITQGQIAGME